MAQYIVKAAPVPSQSIAVQAGLRVSPATIRNEMACLEKEGYIIRPHTSAGSIPSDKGYRFYVESLEKLELPSAEQRLIGHLFHQAEKEADSWLSLAATVLSRLVQNVALVTRPRSVDCKFKHIELVALQDSLALLVLVLYGTKLKQKMITFNQVVPQGTLTSIANKLNDAFAGLTRRQLHDKKEAFSAIEQDITDHVVKIMQAEDELEYEEPYFDGLHFSLNQPEFSRSRQIQPLMELVEHGYVLKTIIPRGLNKPGTWVIIGKENETEAFHDYSIVICQYGFPDEGTGIIGVVGPTRMPYAHAIPAVGYLSLVLNSLLTSLYQRETPSRPSSDATG